jgi:hypothetical protein
MSLSRGWALKNLDVILVWAVIVGFLVIAAAAIDDNRYRKVAEMPEEILYQVIVHKNIYPDNFYSSAYTLADPNGFRLETYWIYEQGWQYHQVPLQMFEVDTTINEIRR